MTSPCSTPEINMKYLESNFQIGIVRFLRQQGFYVFAVPNGQRLNLRRAILAKQEGLLAGASDLVIVLQGRVVFAEIKNPNGKGCQSAAQKEFENEVTVRGHEYVVWSDWAEVEAFVNAERKNKGYREIKIGGTD